MKLGLRKLATAARLSDTRSVAILGGTKAAERVCADIRQRPWLRMRIAGVYDDRGTDRLPAAVAAQRRGTCAELLQACRRGDIDTVIVALPIRAEARIRTVVEALGDTTATVYLLADLPSLDLLNAPWTAIGSLPLVGLAQSHGNAVASAFRRIAGPALGRVAAPVVEAHEVNANAAADAPRVGPTA
jgi:putative colanic acid biosysnthesis UDP-glucose lipid carrier transferase